MKDKKCDGVKLYKVNHKGYHDMSNVAQPLRKEDFDIAIKALESVDKNPMPKPSPIL